MMRHLLAFSLATCIGVSALPSASHAQDFPTRTIRIIANQSPGGISDIFIRAVGEELHKRWGQPVVVENRPGGRENIGVRACQDSTPDGYTICILYSDALVYNPHLFKKLPFDLKGVQPMTNLFYILQTMVASADLKVKTLNELVALSKAKPGTLNYTTPVYAAVAMMTRLEKERGADWVRVPFKGGGDAVTALLSGTTQITIVGEGNLTPHIRSGKMTPLAMVNNIRSQNFPDVPTLKEAGYDGPPSKASFGLFAPAGVSRAIIDKYVAEVGKIVNDPAFAAKNLKARSLVGAISTPEAYAAELEKDRAEAAEVVKSAGLEVQ
jgi:tripartite-type tricarboxylate transporter receptor subunit TctC